MTERADGSQRPRSKSLLSFASNKSNGVSTKLDLTETEKEKSWRRFSKASKADPSKAMNEAQPAAWSVEETTIQPLRQIQHRDSDGNPIVDPDLSNPTRPRMERPLDTIRAFEAAIEAKYQNGRPSLPRAETVTDGFNSQNRRSSYYQGHNPQQRFSTHNVGGFYGHSMSQSRPESYADAYGASPQRQAGRRMAQRVVSDPTLYGRNGQGIYPSNGFQQSHDTVHTASGSHATDQWGNSTDPSSENSSIDRIAPVPKPELAEINGFNGFGGPPQFPGPILEEYGHDGPAYGQPGYGRSHVGAGGGYQGNGGLPTPPLHAYNKENSPRVPIKLGDLNGTSSPNSPTSPRTDNSEKRKSWLKRTFSKKN